MSRYGDLKCLAKEVELAPDGLFKPFVVVFIQHLLRDAPPFVHALVDRGAETIYVVGIPYSTKAASVDSLNELPACRGRIATPAVYPIDSQVEQVLRAAFEDAARSGRRVLIIEDGPYAVARLAEGGFDVSLCAGAVQQTMRGLRRYEILEIAQRLPVAAIEVVRTAIKEDFEALCVAPIVVSTIRELLSIARPGEEPFQGKVVTVVGGAGTIGRAVIGSLLDAGSSIQVYDTFERRLVFTSLAYARKNVTVGHITQLMPTTDLLICCTGQKGAVDGYAVELIKDGCVLASASSGNEEIDLEALEALSERRVVSPRIGDPPALIPAHVDYVLRGGRRATLLYNGFPVNFWSDSLSATGHSDPVIALLFAAARWIATQPREIKIHAGKTVLQTEEARIAKRWIYFSPR